MYLKRMTPLENCQLKFASDDTGQFEGYASVFDSVDKVGDTMARTAFDKTLASGKAIKMFVNHKQHEVPVGDWVDMSVDSVGLKAKGVIDMNHKDGLTVYSALKRGAMDGLSIGFTADEGDVEEKDGGRLFKSLDLMETSIVSFPCEGKAVITAVKSDIDRLYTLQDFEQFLRESGFTKSLATAYVSQLVKQLRSDSARQQEITGMESKLRDVFADLRKRFE